MRLCENVKSSLRQSSLLFGHCLFTLYLELLKVACVFLSQRPALVWYDFFFLRTVLAQCVPRIYITQNSSFVAFLTHPSWLVD